MFSIRVKNAVDPDQINGFIRIQLIWIYSVFKKGINPLSAVKGLKENVMLLRKLEKAQKIVNEYITL